MAGIRKLPDTTFLRECFEYDPSNGVLRWRTRPPEHFAGKRYCDSFNTRFAGKIVGKQNSAGYLQVQVVYRGAKRALYVHRVAFALHYGFEPQDTDHVNGVRSDNRAVNLRTATRQENRRNGSAMRSRLKGAYLDRERGSFVAATSVNGRRVFIGRFATEEAAHAAYCTFAQGNYGPFYRAG